MLSSHGILYTLPKGETPYVGRANDVSLPDLSIPVCVDIFGQSSCSLQSFVYPNWSDSPVYPAPEQAPP